jgi:riboflavin kinase / FMN adenylyltransferase
MKTFTTLTPLRAPAIALTIGMFDGVHLGHQAILRRVRERAKTAVCLTFSNHPASILTPEKRFPLLSSAEQKERLIAKTGIDFLFLIPFTAEFAQQEAEPFLTSLHLQIPFRYLVLGYDARLGHRRGGTPERVQSIGASLGFEVEYLQPIMTGGRPISSRRIREAIQRGDLAEAEQLLGRRVSFVSLVHPGTGHGRRIGYPTANLDIEGVCLPPFGVYAVALLWNGRCFPGVANLGVAPTLQQNRQPMLEVHLFDVSPDLYEHEVEVVLYGYLRSERRFENAEALRHQISQDIEMAKALLTKVGE